jgi:hypothetical protein
MRLKSLHPGVTLEQVQEATGFDLLIEDSVVLETPVPTVNQVRLIREVIDPDGMRLREFGR